MNKKILVPLVTPFREDESVDYEMLKKLVRYELDSGADGLYVGGSSAECFLLTAEERKKVLETAVRAAGTRSSTSSKGVRQKSRIAKCNNQARKCREFSRHCVRLRGVCRNGHERACMGRKSNAVCFAFLAFSPL